MNLLANTSAFLTATGLVLVVAAIAAGCPDEASYVVTARAAPAPESRPPGAADATRPPDAATRTPPPFRLVERLDRAEIRGPLAFTQPGRAREIPARAVLRESFERFDPTAMGWPAGTAVRIQPRPDGKGRDNPALHFRGGAIHRHALLLPVTPRTWYRVRRSVRTDDSQVDLRVVEMRSALLHPEVRNHPADLKQVLWGKFVHPRRLLEVHRFPRVLERDAWDRGELLLFTTPLTRSLVLVLEDAIGSVTGSTHEVWLDDVEVEHLSPTLEQELYLVAALAPGGDAPGMLQHGRLLPFVEPQDAAPPADANHDHRVALLAPAGTALRFSERVPPGARLHLSYGLHRATQLGGETTFIVAVQDAEGAAQELLRERLQASDDAWHWHDATVPLGAHTGQKVTLTLRTEAPRDSRAYALWGDPVIEAPRRRDDPPNLILIGIDTIRADRLSCYGHDRLTTPRLDALAADGVRFEHAISPSNWTSPAFASLFTGALPARHELLHRARLLPDELTTLAERLRAAGYDTHAIAYKPYLYNMGFEQGFSTWSNVPDGSRTADDTVGRALAWLERSGDRRFFLFLHLNDPHQPFNQPPPFDHKFNTSEDLLRFGATLPLIIMPRGGVLGCKRCRSGKRIDPAFEPVARALYDGELRYLDERLGRLFNALKRRGIYDDTAIAFVGDHGELMWDRGIRYFGHAGPYLYDELVRVPLIVKPPRGRWARGSVVNTQVRIHDLAPTLAALAGAAGPGGNQDFSDARSLVPLLRPGARTETDRTAISENLKQRVLSVRRDGFKYILRYRQDRPVEEKLFQLSNDPGETRDTAAAQPAMLVRLRGLAAAHWLESRPGPFLLVLGLAGARPARVVLRADRPLRGVERLVGPRGSGTDRGMAFVVSGAARDTVALAARIMAPPGTRLEATVWQDLGGDVGAQQTAVDRLSTAQCAAELSRRSGELRALLCE